MGQRVAVETGAGYDAYRVDDTNFYLYATRDGISVEELEAAASGVLIVFCTKESRPWMSKSQDSLAGGGCLRT